MCDEAKTRATGFGNRLIASRARSETVSETVFIDGKFYPKEKAKISVFDHGLLYGDGVFEGIRLYSRCVFRLREHLERLFSSAKYIALKIPLTIDELTWATVETCRRNGLKDGYIRLVVTRGEGDLGLSPLLCKKPSVVLIASKVKLYPEAAYRDGLKIITVPTQRMSVAALSPRVKSCNYLNNILAKLEGLNSGVNEALMLNDHGYVVECTGDNIFVVKGKKVLTPPTALGALQGITRNCIIDIAREMGFDVREEPFTRFEIFDADECFMTGTAAEVVPVVNLDARPVGNGRPGRVTKRLNRRFREIVSSDGTSLDQPLPRPKRLSRVW
ncbi:branched-chain-amino-acid transaminase [Candidatus Sumerlaeota bacterium]|nr:branched-chain-amino-acid transaminase [Candidatus Sumerlaeota bacterium]